MAAKITKDILESYLHCKYKGYLKLTGQQGTKSDYETLLIEMRAEVRLAAIDKILARHPGEEIPRNIPLTTSALKQGASFILDATLDDDLVSLHFEGLKKVDGPSKLGDFHYIPILFHEGEKVRKEPKLLLELYGLLLSRLQGQMPAHGIVWHGKECKATRVRLNADLRKTERMLRDLKEMCIAESPPRLMLNDHCQVCEFRQRCHEQAVKDDNVSLLRGLGEKEIRTLGKKGIFTVTQLAHTFRPRRKSKRTKQRTTNRNIALQALAIRDKRIYVLGTPDVPAKPVQIYLDIEGIPEDGFVYLIGMIVKTDGLEQSYSFWANNKDEERDIFEKMIAEIVKHDGFIVYCYGAYERAFIKRMMQITSKKTDVDKVLDSLVNALSIVYSNFFFPTYTNGLKDIGTYLGCSWSETDSSGIQSIVWRRKWEVSNEESWKQKLAKYNIEDCHALRHVMEFIYATIARAIQGTEAQPSVPITTTVTQVEDVEKLQDYEKWGDVDFFFPDFQHVNKCSHFDYQRERVYARSRKLAKRKRKSRKKRWSLTLRITKHVRVTVSKCPSCGGTDLSEVHHRDAAKCPLPKSKRALDLEITSIGVKRKVIEFRTAAYCCGKCGDTFVSEPYQRIDKYFHKLKAWAIFQHIAYRLSFKAIQNMFEELFSLHLCYSDVYIFKSVVADYYRSTYWTTLKRILSGKLLHIDETDIKLQGGKKVYVWVFSNLEDVVFMYKPTREGEFLQKLLKNFKGVLVSDFYSVYDGINCAQQKCLIHLMRDMNQELLSNPFDLELQAVTRPFGVLLREIVATIDQHGLKKTALSKHAKRVESFFRNLSEQSFRSEAATSIQHRLLKYRNKLFTFMEYDDVPWNNNNAEHAIKDFAHYRELNTGNMSVAGLSDYLVLLSICVSCRYKDISFFRFLLSGQKDVQAFAANKKQKRLPTIETYSKRNIPPYILHRQRKKASRKRSGSEKTDGGDPASSPAACRQEADRLPSGQHRHAGPATDLDCGEAEGVTQDAQMECGP